MWYKIIIQLLAFEGQTFLQNLGYFAPFSRLSKKIRSFSKKHPHKAFPKIDSDKFRGLVSALRDSSSIFLIPLSNQPLERIFPRFLNGCTWFRSLPGLSKFSTVLISRIDEIGRKYVTSLAFRMDYFLQLQTNLGDIFTYAAYKNNCPFLLQASSSNHLKILVN